MRIRSLVAHNFVCYRDLVIKDFPKQGLIGIKGINIDNPIMGSNAVGKSALLDMFTYCWQGEIVRKKRANVVGPFDKQMRISLTMFDDNTKTKYTIRKTKKRNGGERVIFIVNGKKYKGTPTKIQPIIRRTLGIGWLTFKNCIIYSDEASDDHFMRVADNKRKEILSEIADITHLRVARKLIAEDIKEEKQQLSYFEGELSANKNRVEDAGERLKRCRQKLEDHEKETEEKKEKLKRDIELIEKEINRLPKLQEDLKETITLIKRSNKDITTYNDELANERDEELVKKEHRDFDRTLVRQTVRVTELEDQLEIIEQEGRCPTCLSEDIDGVKQRINTEIKRARRDKKETKSKVEALKKELKEIQLMKHAIQESKDTLEQLRELRSETEKQISIVKHNVTRRALLEEKLSKITTETELLLDTIAEEENNYRVAKEHMSKTFFSKLRQQQEVGTSEFWLERFGQHGIQAEFIHDLVNNLNIYANDNIQKLTDNDIELEITPTRVTKTSVKNEIVIKVIHGGKAKEYALYSGGQKNRISRAISMALMQLNQDEISFKLFDEIGKDLSQDGYERVVELMKERLYGQQLFQATNNDEIQKLFDYTITITMRNGESTIETSW